jgi:pimeloyl-ACP methyl ester carboxylesterase
MQCYCISGLGADFRLFSRLNVPDATLIDLPWLPPEDNETIEHYAGRMKAAIVDDNPILIGVSFGGMMAVEIAKLHQDATVILISSIRDRHQRPDWMTFCGRLRLEHLIPRRIKPPKRSNWLRDCIIPLEEYMQGIKTIEDGRLYRDFRSHIDYRFSRWAIKEILHWKNEWIPSRLYHIHGRRDRIFQLPDNSVSHLIKDGGHFMVYNRAALVSYAIQKILQGLPAATAQATPSPSHLGSGTQP